MTEKEELEFEMKPHYDFSNGRPNPYSTRARLGRDFVRIEADLLEVFPTSEAVNEALRLVVKAGALTSRPQIVAGKIS